MGPRSEDRGARAGQPGIDTGIGSHDLDEAEIVLNREIDQGVLGDCDVQPPPADHMFSRPFGRIPGEAQDENLHRNEQKEADRTCRVRISGCSKHSSKLPEEFANALIRLKRVS